MFPSMLDHVPCTAERLGIAEVRRQKSSGGLYLCMVASNYLYIQICSRPSFSLANVVPLGFSLAEPSVRACAFAFLPHLLGEAQDRAQFSCVPSLNTAATPDCLHASFARGMSAPLCRLQLELVPEGLASSQLRKCYTSDQGTILLGRGGRHSSTAQLANSGSFRDLETERTAVMSSQHAQVTWGQQDTYAFLTDKGSTNGTYLSKYGDSEPPLKLRAGVSYRVSTLVAPLSSCHTVH